jgi:hypothetical protein
MLPSDVVGELNSGLLIANQSAAATVTGSWVDTQTYQGQLIVVANIGAKTAGTNPTMDVKIQDATDNSGTGSADVTGGAFTQVTTVDSIQLKGFERNAVRRYVRAVATLGGTSSPAFPVAVSLHSQAKGITSTF